MNPCASDQGNWTTSTSFNAWKQKQASTKLNILANIVLKLHGIKTLKLKGWTLQNKWKKVFQEFQSSTHTAGLCVLILSMVGLIGLNLACANIMIIASALDNEQLSEESAFLPAHVNKGTSTINAVESDDEVEVVGMDPNDIEMDTVPSQHNKCRTKKICAKATGLLSPTCPSTK
ncbi:hypothetical protein J3R82DRAFT_2841 [Butyriboletus roseoflavus]|nr:hypothetical protein J3R82DRAFT_2841 [Butyriboletus roseoflavus]